MTKAEDLQFTRELRRIWLDQCKHCCHSSPKGNPRFATNPQCRKCFNGSNFDHDGVDDLDIMG